MIEIKRLDESRWMDYKEIRLEALKEEPSAFGSSYEYEKEYPDNTWKAMTKNALFAAVDNKVVGMLVLIIPESPKVMHIANIFGIYVKKDYRRKGLGKLLLNAVLIIAKEKNLVKIKLTVNPEMEAAVNLYKKYGFVVAGWLKKELKVNEKFYDELIMEKYL